MNKPNFKIIELQGKSPGKNTLIMGGVHGDERCGVEEINNLSRSLEIEKGKVTLILANIEAIKQDKRYIEANLNRCFLKKQPEDIKNTLEGETARQLMPYLEKADALLDIHASFTPKSEPFAICDEKWLKEASLFETNKATFNWDPFEPGSTDYYMNLLKKPAFCFECGYLKNPKTQEIAEKGILNFLKWTENIRGLPKRTKNQQKIKVKSIYKSKTNFLKAREFRDFEKLEADTTLGFDGQEIIKTKKESIVLFVRNIKLPGQECFIIAEDFKEGKK